MEYHSISMERAFWWGTASEGTLNGKPWRSTGGIDSFIPAANKKAITNPTTMALLEEELYNIFKFGSSEKMAFCGNRALLAINQIVRMNGHMNIESGIKEFGMNVSRFTSPFGDIVLKTHPLFNMSADTSAANPGDESTMFVLDMENVKYVCLKSGDTKYQKKLEENGMDGQKSGYLTESGLEVRHPKTHYKITGLRVGAPD